MVFLYDVFVVLHFIGWAIVLGGYIASLRTPGLYPGVFHGAMTVVVSGLIAVGIAEASSVVGDPNMAKIGVKLVIAMVIAVLAYLAKKQGAKADNGTGVVSPALKHGIGALTLVNIVLAVFIR